MEGTSKQLACPCGTHIVGESEDDLVEKVLEHLRAEHPELANTYGRDEILTMAY